MGSFAIELSDEPSAMLEKVSAAVSSMGGKCEGDESAGTIELRTPMGPVGGTYAVSGRTMTMDIHKKPMMVPQSMIEQAVRQWFGAAQA